MNFFNTLTLKQIFWKKANPLKKLVYRFLFESTKIENAAFPDKTALCQQLILRQIAWGVQNRPITKKGVLPVTASSF